jgi:hypothetical protein
MNGCEPASGETERLERKAVRHVHVLQIWNCVKQ